MNKLFFLIISSLTLSLSTFAQEDPSRQIIPEEFVKARPSKATSGSTASGQVKYQRATAKNSTETPAGAYQQLGLTIWRLRPSKVTDTGARIIVHEDQATIEWTPERMAANMPLKVGEKIRLSFEAPQAGYLYVIDREKYADGSVGEPYLIFPTKKTRGGDNQVAPGHIIEIPGQDDQPNFFTLKQTRRDQVEELVTVIVSAQPLPDITIGDKALQLAPALVAQWEKQWSANTESFELAGGVGRTWTKAEQQAGANATRQLTQDDPSPQTVYRVGVKPGTPMLVQVGLKYARKVAPPTRARAKRTAN